MERLQKVIAAAGITSRRKAEALILEGRVKVNSQTITELGYKVKKRDIVEVDGKEIQKENRVYYVMNKPKRTICTLNDQFNRKTVVSLIPCEERIFTVGRLDYDTSGVIILTNDGEFANLLIHPRYHLPKKYEVMVDTVLNSEQVKRLERGVKLDDGVVTLPAKVKITNKDLKNNKTKLELTIKEGRNRQIKRMMEAVGCHVTALHRRSIGPLQLDDMKPGEYRLLKPFEVKQLRKLAEEGLEIY